MIDPLILMALAVGIATYGFRVEPTKLSMKSFSDDGRLARFLAATGPAAIATLCTASVIPMVRSGAEIWPWLAGALCVVAAFFAARSVVLATLAGAVGYGAAFMLVATSAQTLP